MTILATLPNLTFAFVLHSEMWHHKKYKSVQYTQNVTKR